VSAKADSRKTVFLALGANFAIFATKLVAALLTGSGSMSAEAVHSLADCGNQGLLLLGMRRVKQAPTANHPLGRGMEIYFWSFLVALLLFLVGGVYSIYEGVHKLQIHEPLHRPWLAIGVLGFGFVAESFSMWGCMREVNKARAGQSLWRWFVESRQSELIVVFGEDLAALIGLGFALVAVLATIATGNPLFDAWGSIAIGALLCVVAIFVARKVAALLVGHSVEPRLHAAINAFLLAQPEVELLFNVIAMQLGPDVMVAVKAQMRGELSGRELIDAINRVEAVMKAQFPEIRWSFFEPDVAD
jgi:cation diffusion facilitator family transporter